MKREIQTPQRKARMLFFRVTGTGVAAIDEGTTDATLTDNGAGDWTLTFTEAFSRIPSVIPVPATAATIATIGTVTASAVQILCLDATDGATPKDALFHVHVAGWDTADIT